MKRADNRNDLNSLMQCLVSDPQAFFRHYSFETSRVEYKASFEYDAAMDLCPAMSRRRSGILNPALSQRILETLVAFANTCGGLLIMGVAEEGSRLVNPGQFSRCKCIDIREAKMSAPCCDGVVDCPGYRIGHLNLVGIDRELSIYEGDFDRFQRRIRDRFSHGTGKSRKPAVKFKPVVYPCDAGSGENLRNLQVGISLSQGIDQYIEEILPVTVKTPSHRNITLGVIAVKPAGAPIYMTIDSSGSQNIMYALPIRKTGQTELEKDLQRVQAYIESRFGNVVAEKIAERLRTLTRPDVEADELSDSQGMIQKINEYADQWQRAGYAYHVAESRGKRLEACLKEAWLYESVKEPVRSAFLLMVSLHYGTAWDLWALKNTGNPLAVSAMMKVFHQKYWRPRFRTLYALQHMAPALVREELDRPCHASLSPVTRNVLLTHVPGKTVTEYLRRVADGPDALIARKAGDVLREIASQWGDDTAGVHIPL